ncbi:hypothetical protein ACJ72_05572 [Emergomyces africanus]|uniref:Uncharacterized protein n=1 Tax=Emergomyces africanus TaxID=1955775 RepID=A0A1B7NTK1_9EURO|nr:hypothetical protein ACJ72_05572 [Emergomyces africanus]
MKQPRFPLPRGHWCSKCHLQNYWIPYGQARCFNLHPEDAPPEWDPWAVKKTLAQHPVHVVRFQKATHGRPATASEISLDSRLYQEYMLNTLLADVPISGEEEVEPKEYFDLDKR